MADAEHSDELESELGAEGQGELPESFEQRRLCPNESCIGVLDARGVCPECGASAEPGNEAEVELAHRALCPDGACVGVIGPDGRCKECGQVSAQVTADPRLRGLKPEPESASSDEGPADFEDRQLCPDGACVGIIGSDGKCRECGLAA